MAIDPTWLQKQFPDLQNIQPLIDGGQKSVFTATHPSDGEIVLKLFHPGSDVDRTAREVEAVATISCPRVPQILEHGTASSSTGDVIWFRETFIEGETLRGVLRARSLANDEILRIALHTLEALKAAEDCRIVHRDIKPENIIIGPDGSAWVLDFGLARHLDKESLTATALAWGMGTLGYSPPEQFRNLKREQDSRTDLFALGITLHECVEGNNPLIHGARDQAEVLRRVESSPLPRISRAVDSADSFGDLVLAMTRIKIHQRPAGVLEALGWIQDICRNEKVQ